MAEVILARPPANILTAAMMAEIGRAVNELARTPSRKCIVIAGEGSHFSYGASVEEHQPGVVNDMLPAFHRMIGLLVSCDVPLVAKVRGLCLGGGFELALACGAIFAEEGAKFAVPEIQLGVFPPVAAALLPAICGATVAAEIVSTGEKFAASALKEARIVNRVCAPEALDAAVSEFVTRHYLPRSASSLRIATRATRGELSEIYQRRIGVLEPLYLKDLMRTNDACEGIAAFVEKRKPTWKNS